MNAIFQIISFLCLIAGVAFYTWAERKLLRYAQIRVGPNKVSILGALQPIRDALKLLTKKLFFPQGSNRFVFVLAPSLSLILALISWVILLDQIWVEFSQTTMLWFLFILSIGVFPSTLAGWASNRAYARVGGYRSLAQTISYEVALFLRIFVPLSVYERLILKSWHFPNGLFLLLIILGFLIVFLAETNRAPFDLSEGERELVSGFNIEYGGAGFTLFFLAEYGIMLIISIWVSVFFFSTRQFSFIFILLLLVVRAAYPRLRYDDLISFMWKIYLPLITRFCSIIFILI